MESKNLVQKGNTLQVQLIVNNYNKCKIFTTKLSPEYIFSGQAVFQVKVMVATMNNNYNHNNLIFIKFVKLRDNDLTYSIKLSSNELGVINKRIISNDGTWHLIAENKKEVYAIDISVVMDVLQSASTFASLQDDSELIDFELMGEDGSVCMHKAVLAASSPVLRRMLGGTWKETTEGHVEVPGTSKLTLQLFKDYLYLNTLPEDGLKQLLLLASYYMISDLEQRCVHKLVNCLTAENACELLEFAVKHKIRRLLLAILECVQIGAVNVNDMKKHFMQMK